MTLLTPDLNVACPDCRDTVPLTLTVGRGRVDGRYRYVLPLGFDADRFERVFRAHVLRRPELHPTFVSPGGTP